jgi:cysteinyl-tRNA synthetase
MDLTIYNSLTREKERFEPIDESNVRLYVCGPTVYDFAHIGNARPVVVFDTLFRVLRDLYGADAVTYVRNITDVDDKINARARESGEDIRAITERTVAAYHEDMDALGALRPTIEPRATEHIGQMIAMTEKLIARGHAYEADGHVLFSVSSDPQYGQLSGRSMDEMIAGARVEVAPYKRDPADFVLWKPSTPDLPGWDSPWGRGRPGWHIECSAMGEAHLGEVFDIHGGGIDLIFPHHENEIAQSACAHHGQPHARYWMHNGFLMVEGEKMSKSLGNFFTVRDLLADWPGEVLRYTMLSTHYRQPIDWTKAGMQQAKDSLDRLYRTLKAFEHIDADEADVPESVLAPLLDDLNTPLALSALHELATKANKSKNDPTRGKYKAMLLAGGQALGLFGSDPDDWLKRRDATADGPTEAEIEQLIAGRIAARKNKDFAEADRIRGTLADQGIILEDGPQGTTWRRG